MKFNVKIFEKTGVMRSDPISYLGADKKTEAKGDRLGEDGEADQLKA